MNSRQLLQSILILTYLFGTVACLDKNQQGQSSSPAPQAVAGPVLTSEGGGGTDVGSGGQGAAADWMGIAQEISEKLRLLQNPPVEAKLWRRIKTEVPKLIKETPIQFKDYPLILGAETADRDNPSKARYAKGSTCGKMIVEGAKDTAQERDAINFSANGNQLIKASLPRFGCLQKTSIEIRRLVLHEYLGLMGIQEKSEDGVTHYEITNAILAAFKIIPSMENGLETVLIRSCEEVQSIGDTDANAYVLTPSRVLQLANDIDCAKSETWDDGKGFLPLVLSQHFDGNGYTIRNLHLQMKVKTESRYELSEKYFDPYHGGVFFPHAAGLFLLSCRQCEIANLTIEDSSSASGALLIGKNLGKITNVMVRGSVRSNVPAVAGLAGANDNGTIAFCSAEVSLEGVEDKTRSWNQMVGGLVATNSGIIHHSSARARIRGGKHIGGLVGNNGDGLVSSVNASVDIDANRFMSVGGLVGLNSGTILNGKSTGRIRIANPIFTDEKFLKSHPDMDFRVSVGGLVGDTSEGKEVRDIKKDQLRLYRPYAYEIRDSRTDVSICGSATEGFPREEKHGLWIGKGVGTITLSPGDPNAHKGVTATGHIQKDCK
jgi:hypothetical protein